MLIRVTHDGMHWKMSGLEWVEGIEHGDHRHFAPLVEAAFRHVTTRPDVLTVVDPLGSVVLLELLDEPQQTSGGLVAQYATPDHGEAARMPPRV